ncbi:MAG: OmpA family protein [Candidatus Limisoma sp.]
MDKIKVYGRAQNRTALGIAHAYMVMNPQATLEDLRKAFPNSLSPDKGVKENFVLNETKDEHDGWKGYFREPDELLHMGDGTLVAMNSMWTAASFQRIVEKAKEYDITVAEFSKVAAGEKGGFRLEYLNGYVAPTAKPKSKKLLWIIIAVVLLLAAIAAFLFLNSGKTEATVVAAPVDTVAPAPVDTVIIAKVETIEQNFNAAQFQKNSAELTDAAKQVLDELVQVLKDNEALKVRIIGHSSAEGSETHNQELSEQRAQVAADYLVSAGIDKLRVTAIGKGSSEPKDAENLDANRRTEFEVE